MLLRKKKCFHPSGISEDLDHCEDHFVFSHHLMKMKIPSRRRYIRVNNVVRHLVILKNKEKLI